MITAHLRRRHVSCLFSHSLASFSFSVLQFSSLGTEAAKSCKKPSELEFLLHRHKFSPKVVSRVVSVLKLRKKNMNFEKYESTLSYLKEFGFTKSELEKTLNSAPCILRVSDKTFQPKVKIFQDIGLSSMDIVSIILKDPNILRASAKNRLRAAILHLQAFLGSSEEVARTVRRSPWLLIADWEHRLIPNIKFLQQCCGITKEHIVSNLIWMQRCLSSKPEFMRECIARVDDIGVDRDSKMFSYAVATVGSFSRKAWKLKWQAYRNILECSDEDISTMFKRCPMVFSMSGDKVKRMKEFLLNSKYNNLRIYECPNILSYSIENRYKPRCEVLTILKRRLLVTKWPCLYSLGVMTDAKFFDRYVRPHLKDPEISMWYKNNPTRAGGRLISAA